MRLLASGLRCPSYCIQSFDNFVTISLLSEVDLLTASMILPREYMSDMQVFKTINYMLTVYSLIEAGRFFSSLQVKGEDPACIGDRRLIIFIINILCV